MAPKIIPVNNVIEKKRGRPKRTADQQQQFEHLKREYETKRK